MATKNFVPRATGEGNIGTSAKHWLKGWFDTIFGTTITNGSKTTTVANLFTADNTGEYNALTEKTTPVDADLMPIEDSAASNAKKKVQLGNLQFIKKSVIAAKGNILGGSAAATPAVTAVGADGKLLKADSTQSSGLGWVAPVVSGASTVGVSGAYAVDTYLAGSAVTIPVAGGWLAGTTYYCTFDMVKTNVGTAAFTIQVRMGTAGTTSDASVLQLAFAVGSAAVDTGVFELWINFRSVGGGTAAVVQGVLKCSHHLAATGLITTGASGNGIIVGTSSGFNSTTQTIIGISVNGGASFSGTNTMVQAEVYNV